MESGGFNDLRAVSIAVWFTAAGYRLPFKGPKVAKHPGMVILIKAQTYSDDLKPHVYVRIGSVTL